MSHVLRSHRLDSLAGHEESIAGLFLQAIDACGEELQTDILTVLPELITEAEHEVGRWLLCRRLGAVAWREVTEASMVPVQEFVTKLEDLCQGNGSLLLPGLQAVSNLCLDNLLQVIGVAYIKAGAGDSRLALQCVPPCAAGQGKGHGPAETRLFPCARLAHSAALLDQACHTGQCPAGELSVACPAASAQP